MMVMMIMEICWWQRVKNQKCRNKFICSYTSDLWFICRFCYCYCCCYYHSFIYWYIVNNPLFYFWFTHICMHMCMGVCVVSVYVHAYIHIHLYIYIYIYIYLYIYTLLFFVFCFGEVDEVAGVISPFFIFFFQWLSE